MMMLPAYWQVYSLLLLAHQEQLHFSCNYFVIIFLFILLLSSIAYIASSPHSSINVTVSLLPQVVAILKFNLFAEVGGANKHGSRHGIVHTEVRTVLDRSGTLVQTVPFWNRSEGTGSVHTALWNGSRTLGTVLRCQCERSIIAPLFCWGIAEAKNGAYHLCFHSNHS